MSARKNIGKRLGRPAAAQVMAQDDLTKGSQANPRRHSHRDDPSVPDFDDTAPVAVMDAECAICSWGARMIHRLDRSGTVRICPVRSPLGTALLRHYGLRPDDPTSWLFLDDGMPHVDFEAVLHAGKRFGGWARLTTVLYVLPEPLRGWIYRRLARNRYAVFGRADLCALPDRAFRKRLLQ
ncbi:MAG: DCC1-like thiol-disulfide oxidoreductase family protein [Pseudomonadota bacterium]